MVKKAIALVLCGVFWLVLSAGCDSLGLGGSGGGGGGRDGLADADPMDVALADVKAAYLAYAIQGMIEQMVADPDAVDDMTLQAMAEQLAPEAAAKAEEWSKSLDPTAIPLFTPDPDKQASCVDKYGCKFAETCDFAGGRAVCQLTNCGQGKCSGCPDVFNVSNAIVKGWCAHVCLRGAPSRVVGYKAVIHFRTGGEWRYCYEASNQN